MEKTFLEALEIRELSDLTTQVDMVSEIVLNDESSKLFDYLKLYPANKIEEVIVDYDSNIQVGIGAVPEESTINARKVRFSPKPLKAKIVISKNALYASGANWVQFVNKIGKKAMIEKIIKQVLNEGTATGTESTSLQSIIKTTELDAFEVEFIGAEAKGMFYEEHAKRARNELNEPADIAFIIPTKQVIDIAQSDTTTAYQYDNLPPAVYAKLFGKPVFNGELGTGTEFTNIVGIVMSKGAYGLAMSDITITAISGDTANASAGSITFIVECYADGKVLDYKGIKLLGFNTASATATVQ